MLFVVGHRRTVSDVSFPYHEKPMKQSPIPSHHGIKSETVQLNGCEEENI